MVKMSGRKNALLYMKYMMVVLDEVSECDADIGAILTKIKNTIPFYSLNLANIDLHLSKSFCIYLQSKLESPFYPSPNKFLTIFNVMLGDKDALKHNDQIQSVILQGHECSITNYGIEILKGRIPPRQIDTDSLDDEDLEEYELLLEYSSLPN